MSTGLAGSRTHSLGISTRSPYQRSFQPFSCGSEISERKTPGARTTEKRTAFLPGRSGASTIRMSSGFGMVTA